MERIVLPLMMFGEHKGKLYTPQNSKGLFPTENHIFVNIARWDPKEKKMKNTGQRALSKIAEAHRDKWRLMALSWKNRNGYRIPPKEKVYADVWFYFPDKRIRDTHNVPKLLLDALKGVIAEDDYYILLRIQDFEIDPKDPRIEIEVIPYELGRSGRNE